MPPFTRPGHGRGRAAMVVLTLCAASMAAQERAPQRLQSGVSLVSLDVLAIGRDGRPVADLRPEDMTLKIGGKATPVASMNLIDTTLPPGTALAALPPPFGSNVATHDRRAFVLAVDDDSFRVGTERALREAADVFLDNLAPGDRIALMTMPYGGTRVHLTTEQEMVREALSKVIGQAAPTESADETACRSRRTLESLAGLLEGLGAIGSPVTVVFFSASMAGPNEQVIRSGQAVATCALRPETWEQVGRAAASAAARLYIVEPVGMSNRIEGLEHLAGVTGAVRLHLGGAADNAFTRILRETSSFYRIAFEPDPSQRNGNVYRVDLRVGRADVTLRVQPGVRIDRAGAAGAGPRQLLREPTTLRDLPLRVAGFVSRQPGESRVKVVLVGEPVDPGVSLRSAAAGLVDMNGKLVAQALFEAAELEPAQPITAALVVPPGIYRLRLAASDTNGRTGTADYEMDAQLRQAGPLQLSALVLGLSRGGFVPRLQFSREPVVLAYVEIYGGTAGQQVSASFELARTLNGPAVLTMPGSLAATGGHHSVTAAIPIGGLSPGDYIVRANVGVVGHAFSRVERTLRKGVE